MTKRLKRAEVPVEQKWDLTDLFPSDYECEEALKKLQETAKNVSAFKGKLAESADVLYDALSTYQDFYKDFIPVGTYANLKANADGTDPDNQANAARVSATMAQIGAELSFLESEILEIPSETIKQFLAEKEELRSEERRVGKECRKQRRR